MFYSRTDMMIDNLKNKTTSYDGVRTSSNRICKGKCVHYKAKRPANGSRYASGQVRCQTCEIYLTPEGVKENRFCKCCNFRVRTKPRNSLYKEKYQENVRNLPEPEIKRVSENNGFGLEEPTKEQIKNESKIGKKSTPVYEKTNESLKTYYELKEFLNFTLKLQTNHQLVMLKELLEHGRLHKGEIAESLTYFNNKDSSNIDAVKQFFSAPVFDILLKHELVTIDVSSNYPHISYFSLNVKLTDNQKFALLEDLSNRLMEYNTAHNIPENEFPKANNMRNINWDISDKNLLKYKSKISEDAS